jgi:integrase
MLSSSNAIKLLQKAAEDDSELLPLVAIQLFAGLRRSEVCALDWSEIDLSEKHLEVKGVKSKTRQRRLVTLPDQQSLSRRKRSFVSTVNTARLFS